MWISNALKEPRRADDAQSSGSLKPMRDAPLRKRCCINTRAQVFDHLRLPVARPSENDRLARRERQAHNQRRSTPMEHKHIVLTVALSAIVAFAAGWVGGRLGTLPSEVPSTTEDATSKLQTPAPHADVDRVGSELLAELRGLRTDLRSAMEAGHSREPIASRSNGGQKELLAALKELTAALHEQPVRSERAGSGLGVRSAGDAVGFSTLDALFNSKASARDTSLLHRFWTLQDLIDRYGAPSALVPDQQQGVLFACYSKPGENDWSCQFALYNGQVIYVDTKR
jgi:hypothetical protein